MPATIPGAKLQDKVAIKSITFTSGGTGAQGTATNVFVVTGQVLVIYIAPHCLTSLTESAGTPTLALGVPGAVPVFVAATTATNIDDGDWWTDTGPAAKGDPLAASNKDIAITGNIQTVVAGTNNISAGVIEFTAYWRPLSADGNLVAA